MTTYQYFATITVSILVTAGSVGLQQNTESFLLLIPDSESQPFTRAPKLDKNRNLKKTIKMQSNKRESTIYH